MSSVVGKLNSISRTFQHFPNKEGTRETILKFQNGNLVVDRLRDLECVSGKCLVDRLQTCCLLDFLFKFTMCLVIVAYRFKKDQGKSHVSLLGAIILFSWLS